MADSKIMATLYLTSWQKRMLADISASTHFKKVLGKKLTATRLSKIVISKLDRIHWVTYRIPNFKEPLVAISLYLTDEQISMVRESLGASVAVNALDITPESIASGAIAIV